MGEVMGRAKGGEGCVNSLHAGVSNLLDPMNLNPASGASDQRGRAKPEARSTRKR